ncbi:MAG: TraM recognition domain-containing protein [Sulfurihydrogenibium sp.]|jgi:hypothetical protein|nr:TraM recognition domain-containing protein [Sulfurihydrogenibium sp.]
MEILRNPKNWKGQKTLFERDYKFIKGALYAGYGINLRNPRMGKGFREVDIYKSPDMRSTHLIVLGRTRWGKTRLKERFEVDDIESGFSIFSLDPKMDYDNFEAEVDAVIRTQRFDDLMVFCPPHPDISIRYNPFYGMLPDAISDIAKALSPSSKEAFFSELGGELAKAVSSALYLKGAKEIRFIDLFKYTGVEDIKRLMEEIKSLPDDGYVEIGEERIERRKLKADAVLSLDRLQNKDKTYWSKVNTTIEIMLSQMSTGKVGETFGSAYGNPLRDRMVGGKAFVFSALIGSLYIGKSIAEAIAKLINASHEKSYGALYRIFSKLEPPIAEYWDEGSIAIYDGAFEKINKVGGAGGYIHIFTQSFSDFDMNVGVEGRKVFFDNADFLIMSVLDDDTARYFSSSAGTVSKEDIIWKRNGIELITKEQPLIPSYLFKQMRKGSFHAFIEGSWYRGYSPVLKDRKSIILEPLPYPDSRIVKRFAEKYKMSLEEASRVVREQELMYDYDWIMKEKLADMWVDLREFPYYKNYVLPYLSEKYDVGVISKEIKEEKIEEIEKELLSEDKIEEKIEEDKKEEKAEENNPPVTRHPSLVTFFYPPESDPLFKPSQKNLSKVRKNLGNATAVLIQDGKVYISKELQKEFFGKEYGEWMYIGEEKDILPATMVRK